jgi:hypothetical protein
MDEKISVKAVDQYAVLFSNKVAESFFSRKEKITGSEILNLCDIRQINLFIISDLLTTWKKESENLKSPYFDYTAKPVADALLQFQNTLSNHILIGKSDFLPLLKSAVAQTLYLILAPYDFYSEILDDQKREFNTSRDLKDKIKYLKINKAPLEKLVEHLETKKIARISGKEAFALLDHILEEVNFTPEDIDPYLESFNKIAPLPIETLYETRVPVKAAPVKATPLVKKEPAKPTPAPIVEAKSTLADDLASKKIVRLKESLTINQKFMFTKILFHGDFEIFTEAVDKIDRFDNLDQTLRFLEENYPDWDRESEEYGEFQEILQKRFNS